MKFKHPLSLFFTLLFFAASNSWAGNMYILYDGNCMDRLEYSFENNSKAKDYIVYQVNLNNSEKVILEVGLESNDNQNYLPAQVIKCNSGIFDRKFVESINNQIDKVYLVRKKGRKKYSITPIAFAAYFKKDKEIIEYDSPKYKFKFDLLRGAVGEDLNYVDPYSEIFFEGKLDYQCTGAYLFRQISDYNNNNAHTDIVFVPEIGVIEERSGADIDDAFNNAMRLSSINNSDIEDYFDVLCGEAVDEEPAVVLTEKGEDPDDFFNPVVPEDNSGNNFIPQNQSRTHTVQKGETLYGISKMYKVKVEQIRDWNNLGRSNLIKKGQQLIVSPSNNNAPSSGAFNERGINTNNGNIRSRSTNSNRSTSSGNFKNTSGKSRIVTTTGSRISGNNIQSREEFSERSVRERAPAPFEDGSRNYFRNNNQEEENKYHIVKAGETMASIAMKYGFTTTKFREINQMSPGDMPLIGERLLVSECDCPNNNEVDEFDVSTSRTNFRPKHNLGPDDYSIKAYQGSVFTEKGSPDSYDTRSGRKSSRVSEPDNEPTYSPSGRKMHTVREGENLYQIAKKHGVTVEHLMRMNDFGINEILIPFQKIYIN